MVSVIKNGRKLMDCLGGRHNGIHFCQCGILIDLQLLFKFFANVIQFFYDYLIEFCRLYYEYPSDRLLQHL